MAKKGFRYQDPRDLVSRMLALEELRTLPPELILKLPEKFHAFVKGQKNQSMLLGKDGQKLTKLEINWEYALFIAPQAFVLELFSNFQKVRKEEPVAEMKTV